MDIKNLENKTILITGGSGFIGSYLVKQLIKEKKITVYNLDKLNYASNLDLLNKFKKFDNFSHIKVDLKNRNQIMEIIKVAKPDLIFHLAAESHVDRSINDPENFIYSNILGTFNLLEATRTYWEKLDNYRKQKFRFVHISTDEVFGSLGKGDYFNEDSPYKPRSPYSASKASSDHLVRAWHHTYNLPTLITNCSNNFGPWQFPEKLIPLVVLKAFHRELIPIYGDGENIRDWLFVEDHIDGIIKCALNGQIGSTYCIGGNKEKSNKVLVKNICDLIDEINPHCKLTHKLIRYVSDRPGHDRRYAIDSSKIRRELNWEPKYEFDEALKITLTWYLNNIDWCKKIMSKSNYKGNRLGL